MSPHARAGRIGRGHRFAAHPRCSADKRQGPPTLAAGASRMMQMALGFVSLALAAPVASGYSWSGVVTVIGMTHEPPAGYQPYAATITLRLLEGERVVVAGGVRVPLVSRGS